MRKIVVLVSLIFAALAAGCQVDFLQNTSNSTKETTQANTQLDAPLSINEVILTDESISPASITIKANSAILWKNKGNSPFSLSSPTLKELSKDNLEKDGEFNLMFAVPGTYEYQASGKKTLSGKVVVEP